MNKNATESILVDSSPTIKERETYSFTISNKSDIEIAMKEYLNSKIKSGTKMSSYIRYLIEKDMQENNIVVEGYNYPSMSNNFSADNTDVLNKLKALEQMISENIKYSGQTAYDKLVGLEYLIKELSSTKQPLTTPTISNATNNIDLAAIINKLDVMTNLINSKGNNTNIDYDLEFKNLLNKISNIESMIDKDASYSNVLTEKLSDIESLVSEQASNFSSRELKILISTIEKLSEKINLQTEMIESLQDTISNQNQLIKMLNTNNTKDNEGETFNGLIEQYDARRELAKKKAANMVESEL